MDRAQTSGDRVLQAWGALFPTGISPENFRLALMVAELALRAEGVLKIPNEELVKDEVKKVEDKGETTPTPQPMISTPSTSTPMTVSALARLRGMSTSGVYAAIAQGRLKASKQEGVYQITPQDVAEFMKSKRAAW